MLENGFSIDKITNSIEDVITGESYNTTVIRLAQEDLKRITKKNGWRFNWRSEFTQKDRQSYKLVLTKDKTIQGLLSLQPVENYIELHIIETAPHNYGRGKKYLGAPANLVAFACKLSFDSGFDGFVAFTAKTRLIRHYIETLGAEILFKNRMAITGNSSKKLVNSYYKNYFDGK